jgi:hypothetical protein
MLRETRGRPCRSSRAVLFASLCAAALWPSLPEGAEPPATPTDIQRSAAGRETLGLTEANGFTDLERSVTFIIDPRNALKDSTAYRPAEPGLLPIESTELKGLLEERGGKLVAQQAVKEVFDSFFKLLSRDDQATFKADLFDVLRLPVPPGEVLVTVGARFGVHRGKEAAAAGRGGRLECRVALKAFQLEAQPDEGSKLYSNLASCKILFEDQATGSVPLGAYADPALLAKAALIDALRNKIAVSFSRSRSIREALGGSLPAGGAKNAVIGDSNSTPRRS